MSYYNDVQIILYSVSDKVPWAAVKVWFDENYPRSGAEEYGGVVTYHPDASTVHVDYHDVRWGNGMQHVGDVMASLSKFIDAFAEDGVAWEFVRIGEDTDDIERDDGGLSQYRLWIRREIVLD